MREIKFRAWVEFNFRKCQNRMAYGFPNFSPSTNGFLDNERGISYKLDKVKLMQFTGLKDQNGKEIYEGDILAEGKKKKIILGKVLWSEKEVCYILKRKDAWEVLDHVNEEYCEVIGNIYENPELSKDSEVKE